MPRPATGQVVRRASGAWALRFRACGTRQYVTLGTAEEGWTRAKAQSELQNVLADVRRGIWQPTVAEPVHAPREIPTFHAFASEWFERQTVEGGRRGEGLSDAGKGDLQWRLSNHLLPAFSSRRVDQITVENVDCYRLGKVREGELGVTSINKTLTTLAAILETAVEYELIDRNPARGRRRRCQPSRLTAPGWTAPSTSRRCSTPLAGSMRTRGFAVANAARCSPRSPSPACASARPSLCAGATSTSRAARSPCARPRRTRGCAS
jgi:integrase